MPPIFDYKCEKCDKVVEKITKDGDPLPQCPECGGIMRKMVSGGQSFRLIGEGFYKRTHKDTGEWS